LIAAPPKGGRRRRASRGQTIARIAILIVVLWLLGILWMRRLVRVDV